MLLTLLPICLPIIIENNLVLTFVIFSNRMPFLLLENILCLEAIIKKKEQRMNKASVGNWEITLKFSQRATTVTEKDQ